MLPPRLVPLLAQFDHAVERLTRRLTGPDVDSGDGEDVAAAPLTDAEYLWEPAPGCWSLRPRTDGPGPGAGMLVGAGGWGRDGGRPRPYPPPLTTIAWRLGHLTELLALRADWTVGTHALTQDDHVAEPTADGAVAALVRGADAWRDAMTSADDTALDRVGRSAFPYGSDAEEPFLHVVWWTNQEVLHHGAEIALLRDLYRARA